MVGRRGLQFRGQRRASRVGEFVRMDLRAEPEVRASFQDLSGLVGREVPSVDECITEVREPIRRNRRQHLFPDEIDVGLGPGLEFWRDRVGPEKGRNHIDFGGVSRGRDGP